MTASRTTPLVDAAAVALLALWILCWGAPASVFAAGSAASCCSGAHGAYRAHTPATAQTSDSDGEEAEEGELEEAEEEAGVGGEAEAEEGGSQTSGSPSERATGTGVALSRLKLSAQATVALERHHPSVSTIGFSLILSAPSKLHVTLFQLTDGHGRERWAALPDSLTVDAGRGHFSDELSGHDRLSPGRYRLTVKPFTGRSRSIYLSVRR